MIRPNASLSYAIIKTNVVVLSNWTLIISRLVWLPGVDRFEPEDEGPPALGKHYEEVQNVLIYGNVSYDNVVVSYESPKLLSLICKYFFD